MTYPHTSESEEKKTPNTSPILFYVPGLEIGYFKIVGLEYKCYLLGSTDFNSNNIGHVQSENESPPTPSPLPQQKIFATPNQGTMAPPSLGKNVPGYELKILGVPNKSRLEYFSYSEELNLSQC